MSDPTSESEAVASPAVVAGLVAEVESLRAHIADRLEYLRGVQKIALGYQHRYQNAEASLADRDRRLGAVAALADGPVTVDGHLRSANGDLYISANALRAVLGPVSGAIEVGLSAQSVQANVAEVLSRSGVVEGAGDEFSHPCAVCESDDKACEDSPAGCCDSCRSTGGCTHTTPVAGHEQEVRVHE